MTNILSNILFLLRRPKIIIVLGKGRKTAKEAIYQVLKKYFKIGKEVLLFESDLKNLEDAKRFKFLAKNSSLTILVITNNGEKTTEIRKLIRILPSSGCLILNFDDQIIREIKNENNLRKITFGFQDGADFQATDVRLNSGTNFKMNYKGNIVPVWSEKLLSKEEIYAALSALAIGVILDLNLVKISQLLKNY